MASASFSLCNFVTLMLLSLIQCNGHSNDIDVLAMQSFVTVKPGITSVTFDKLPTNHSAQLTTTDNSILKNNFYEEDKSEGNYDIETPHPLFKFFKNILSSTERKEITDFVQNVGLGPDPSSAHFLERTKNIRYVKVLNEGFEIMKKNFFVQSDYYNDFSGGYRHYYELIPEQIVLGPMYNLISSFIDNLKIPAETIILAQLQSSIIRANVDGGDVTGQGIHTDGCDDAILVCVERDNVQGAENQFHASLDGTKPLGNSTILEAGDGVIFRDNTIFHYVTKATTTIPIARRTMILIHSPFDGSGDMNSNNQHGTNEAEFRLRDSDGNED